MYTQVSCYHTCPEVDRLYFALQKCRSSFKICPPYLPIYEGMIYDAYLQEFNGVMLIPDIVVSSQFLLASVLIYTSVLLRHIARNYILQVACGGH